MTLADPHAFTRAPNPHTGTTGKPKGSWIPWIFVGMFGVIFAVNFVMVVIAVSTFNGLAVDGAYDRGLAYGETLAEAEAQAALGWKGAIGVDPSTGGTARLVVEVTDADGAPLPPMRALAEVDRPVQQGLALTVPLQPVDDTRYVGQFVPPAAGQWDVEVTFHHADGTHRMTRRIFLSGNDG